MLIHHVVTCSLIAASFHLGVFRIGAVLLFLHDINDVFLEAGKMFNYANSNLATVAFGLLLVSWISNRLVLFFKKVLYGSYVYSFPIFAASNQEHHHSILVGLLVVIQCLNIFWFYLMVQLAYRVVFSKGAMADNREKE